MEIHEQLLYTLRGSLHLTLTHVRRVTVSYRCYLTKAEEFSCSTPKIPISRYGREFDWSHDSIIARRRTVDVVFWAPASTRHTDVSLEPQRDIARTTSTVGF